MDHMKLRPDSNLIIGKKPKLEITDLNLNSLDMNLIEKFITINQIYTTLNFFETFQIDPNVFINFMWRSHFYYTKNNNPFHNFHHAVMVTHAGFYYLTHIDLFANMLNIDLQLSFITSCFAHDLDHRGRNNAYEINTASDIAIRYFDRSPLEQHHAASFLRILARKDSNIFSEIPKERLKDIKLSIIENILATDMKVHFPMLAKYKEKVNQEPEKLCKIRL